MGDGARREHDSLGDVAVPVEVLYGAQTARAIEVCGVSGFDLGRLPALIRALGRVKLAAARANLDAGELDERQADAIIAAANEVVAGRWDDQFPLDVVQGGGGTATNMNVNEVIANRAEELLAGERGTYVRVHSNDHVNRSQSTNDVYPTALQIATLELGALTVEAAKHLAKRLRKKAREYSGRERLGRTCLQDALPVPIDAVHDGQAHAIERITSDLERALEKLHEVPLGGTAVGTGFGAADRYRDVVVKYLAKETGLPLRRAQDPFDALANADGLLAVANELQRLAIVVARSAQDFRLLASGPEGGIGEVALPAVLVGSSIMPGKVNPVVPELVLQTSFQVRGSAKTIEIAVASRELELNVMSPVIARQLLTSLADSAVVFRLYADRCISGLVWNADAVEAHLSGSRAELVEQARRRGYRAAAESAKAE